MRYSATVAPKHPKLDTPQAETGIKKPVSRRNSPSSIFLNNFTDSYLSLDELSAKKRSNAIKQ